MIQTEKVWRCNNCGDTLKTICGVCNECKEDYGYTSTHRMTVIK